MPKGCLNKLILFIVISFTALTVLVAGIYIAYLLLLDGVKAQLSSTDVELKARAEKIANFSNIPPSYTVTKALDIVGVKFVLADNPYNDQIMNIVDPGLLMNINSKSLTITELSEKITALINSINNQEYFKINDFKVIRISSFKALDQTIPYMNVSFSFSTKTYDEKYKGMIALVNNKKNKKRLLFISYNKYKEYSQLTAEKFFQNVEF